MFLKGNYPKELEERVQRWLVDDKDMSLKEEELHGYWETLHPEADREVYHSLQKVNKKLGIPVKNRRLFVRRAFLRAAAVIIPLFILAGGYLYLSKETGTQNLIRLSAYNGERKEILLPDGSTVWINGGSTIEYSTSFNRGTRIVRLTGEAYFSVTKNAAMPFIVNTEKFTVKVLGTEFNVSAYTKNERMTTTVNRGLVEVETKKNQVVRLEKDQQLDYNNNTSEVMIHTVNAEDFSIWKTGHLIFNYNLLRDILFSLERRYDVAFEVNEVLIARKDYYSVKFVNNEDIRQVMDVLQDICDITYSIEGRRIRIVEAGR